MKYSLPDMIKRNKLSELIALPPSIERRNGGNTCDMLVGPCSCGAWHDSLDAQRVLSELGDEIRLLHEDMFIQKQVTSSAINQFLDRVEKRKKKHKNNV